MPLPIAIGGLLAGGVISGLVQFFASKAGTILAGLGLTLVGVKGLQIMIGYAITDIQTVVQFVGAHGGGGGVTGLGAKMLQFAAFAGLFDGINIVLSGFFTYASLLSLRFVFARMSA